MPEIETGISTELESELAAPSAAPSRVVSLSGVLRLGEFFQHDRPRGRRALASPPDAVPTWEAVDVPDPGLPPRRWEGP